MNMRLGSMLWLLIFYNFLTFAQEVEPNIMIDMEKGETFDEALLRGIHEKFVPLEAEQSFFDSVNALHSRLKLVNIYPSFTDIRSYQRKNNIDRSTPYSLQGIELRSIKKHPRWKNVKKPVKELYHPDKSPCFLVSNNGYHISGISDCGNMHVVSSLKIIDSEGKILLKKDSVIISDYNELAFSTHGSFFIYYDYAISKYVLYNLESLEKHLFDFTNLLGKDLPEDKILGKISFLDYSDEHHLLILGTSPSKIFAIKLDKSEKWTQSFDRNNILGNFIPGLDLIFCRSTVRVENAFPYQISFINAKSGTVEDRLHYPSDFFLLSKSIYVKFENNIAYEFQIR